MTTHSDDDPRAESSPSAPDADTTPLVPPTDPAAVATAPLEAAAPDPTPTDPAPVPLWRRRWVLIAAPIVAGLIILGAGVGIGWSAASHDERSDRTNLTEDGTSGDRRGDHLDQDDGRGPGHDRRDDANRGGPGSDDTETATPVPTPTETP